MSSASRWREGEISTPSSKTEIRRHCSAIRGEINKYIYFLKNCNSIKREDRRVRPSIFFPRQRGVAPTFD